MSDITITDTETDSATIDLVGLNDINATVTLTLPQPFKTDSDSTIDLKPVKADLDTHSHLAIDPLKLDLNTDSRVHIDPLKTDSDIKVDLRPIVADVCLTANIGKIPNLCIKQPYHSHFGFTLFGTEIWGFSVSGSQDMVVEELDRQPKVAWRGSQIDRGEERQRHKHEAEPASRQAGGLRVRIGS